MRNLFCILLFLSQVAHAQPESDMTGIWKHMSHAVTKSICRNTLTITQYSAITGKPDSLIFYRALGQDVLVFQWNSEGYQALLTLAGQDSSFILRYNSYQHRWHWGCKSRFELPTAYHWNIIPGDSTSYILFTGPPRNGYERLLLLTYLGYATRLDGVSIPQIANKPKRKPWGSYLYLIGKNQKNWWLNSETIGRKMMAERLKGRVKQHGLSGTGGVGEMAVYRRK